jgi:hypothetical protein
MDRIDRMATAWFPTIRRHMQTLLVNRLSFTNRIYLHPFMETTLTAAN